MVSDNITPSNEGRGYVLRRLLRRAARHGRLLGIQGEFLAEISKTVIEWSHEGYPELAERQETILKQISVEEQNFNKTIDQGLGILANMMEEMETKGEKVLSGDNAFKLYDTYGFPLDLTLEILEEKGLQADRQGFEAAMDQQRRTARDARKTTTYMGVDANVYQTIDPAIESKFVGYDRLSHQSKITVLTTEDALVDELKAGQEGTILVEETPLYATMGGQEADRGLIETKSGKFLVEDVIKLQGTKIGHKGKMLEGSLKVGDLATLTVDAKRRNLTQCNHSATHLMQKALQLVLGDHVAQKGSLVDADRLRFDFTHFSPMTPEEIAKVESIVNEEIQKALPVETREMSLEDARKTGAMALFGEKYGEKVRVVSMADFSIELCGGTHVANTKDIGSFKIVSETGSAAGTRRIEALTSAGLMEYYASMEKALHQVASDLKCGIHDVENKVNNLMQEMKNLQKENDKLKAKIAKDAAGDVTESAEDVNGIKILAKELTDVDMNGLRDLGDETKAKLGDAFILFAADQGGKVVLLSMATDEAMKKGAHAGNLIKEVAGLVGGGGGGRPNMAQAGGKNPAGIPDALSKAIEIMKKQLA